jgi:hypothetical protein
MKFSEYKTQKNVITKIANVNVRNAALKALEAEFYAGRALVREPHATIAAIPAIEQAASFVRVAKQAQSTSTSKLSTAMQSYTAKNDNSARGMFVRLCSQRLSDSEIANHADVLSFYNFDTNKIARRVNSQCSAIRRHLLQFSDADCKSLKR